jgi:hypothetical protein
VHTDVHFPVSAHWWKVRQVAERSRYPEEGVIFDPFPGPFGLEPAMTYGFFLAGLHGLFFTYHLKRGASEFTSSGQRLAVQSLCEGGDRVTGPGAS